VYCDTIREEVAGGERVVAVTPHFVASSPTRPGCRSSYGSLPRRHSCLYEEISVERGGRPRPAPARLGGVLVHAWVIPPFELVLHTAPNLQLKIVQGEWDTVARDFHWHLELTPYPEGRTSVGGIAVNAMLPEEAAGSPGIGALAPPGGLAAALPTRRATLLRRGGVPRHQGRVPDDLRDEPVSREPSHQPAHVSSRSADLRAGPVGRSAGPRERPVHEGLDRGMFGAR